MTEQEKTFLAREFDKLENKLDSNYALYINGYKSALYDALEVVNNLYIPIVSVPNGTLCEHDYKHGTQSNECDVSVCCKCGDIS